MDLYIFKVENVLALFEEKLQQKEKSWNEKKIIEETFFIQEILKDCVTKEQEPRN